MTLNPCPRLALAFAAARRADSGKSPIRPAGAAKEAARAADAMAEEAAESEREYKAAYEAGTQWADKLAEEQEARREALDILKERRAAAGISGAAFPGLCDTIRRRVSELRESIVESREERAALARGDGGDTCYFYADDAKLRATFCEGAGLSDYPECAAR